MADQQPQPTRWYVLPIRRYREHIELFRWEWNMANKADYGNDYPEISWDEADRIWNELHSSEQKAG